ncbi:MAG: hypothetical protein ACRDY7_09050 [Acidimicrobiia bacterium]
MRFSLHQSPLDPDAVDAGLLERPGRARYVWSRSRSKVIEYQGRYYHVANLRSPEEFDDGLREALTEAYLDSPP